MPSETRREIAKRLVNERAAMSGDAYRCDLKLVDAIEAALKDRDERAAKIADKEAGEWVIVSRNYKATDPMKNSCRSRAEMAEEIARAIRSEDADAE